MRQKNPVPRVKLPPLPQSRARPWDSVNLHAKCALVLSDVRLPFHDVRALCAAVDFAKKSAPDLVLINGDLLDFYQLSKFDKNPTLPRIVEELKASRQLLRWLRGEFPRARIVVKFGNHEERWERYLWSKAPELVGVELFELDRILSEDIGDGNGRLDFLEFVKDKRCIMLGKLPVFHGHEIGRSSIAPPVNPARGAFLRTLHHVLIGHLHQYSTHSQKTILDKVIVAFSTGCLCDLHPQYLPVNNWSHGFALVRLSRGGAFEVENRRIVRGQVW